MAFICLPTASNKAVAFLSKAGQNPRLGKLFIYGGHQTDIKPASVLANEPQLRDITGNIALWDKGHYRIGFRRPSQDIDNSENQDFVLPQINQ